MRRLIVLFLFVAAVAAAAAWLADRPGALTITWLGYEIRTSFTVALVAVLVLTVALMVLWSLLRGLIAMPSFLSHVLESRRRRKGQEALTKGIVAVAAGDTAAAARHAAVAERSLGRDPLAMMLKAQTAQLSGDHATVTRVFEAMLRDPETEVLGLRGLFVQARQEGDMTAALRLAERAAELRPGLPWATRAVLAIQSAEGDWAGAERTLEQARKAKLIDAAEAAYKRAVVLTARAMEREETDPDAARDLALKAHKLAPELVPAAVLAGRLLAATGQTRKAKSVLEKTWARSPHRDIAAVYAAARPGDPPKERLKRVQALVRKHDGGAEGAVALAMAAIDAADWAEARRALRPLVATRPTARVAELMAEIEEGEHGDVGRAREWLARAVHAPPDPTWTADGYVSDEWRPVSPVTGELGAFRWRVPVEGLPHHRDDAIAPFAEDVPGAPRGEVPVLVAAPEPPDETGRGAGPATPEPPSPAVAAPPPAVAAAPPPPPPEPAPATAGPSTAEPAAGTAEEASAKPQEPVVFVPPHAPDDPGPPEDGAGDTWFDPEPRARDLG